MTIKKESNKCTMEYHFFKKNPKWSIYGGGGNDKSFIKGQRSLEKISKSSLQGRP